MDLVAFYRGEAPDNRGRTLSELWAWDDDRLEEVHDYIQVLFPNRDPSAFNTRAPLLDDATVAAFRADPTLRANLARSHDRLLGFYGLRYDEAKGTVVRAGHFPERAANWLEPYNHNLLRITRILKCLMALGLEERARAFFACLEGVYRDYPDVVGAGTFEYWRQAVAE